MIQIIIIHSYTQINSNMTPNNNGITFGYIICRTNDCLDNIIKIDMSLTEPENFTNEIEYQDNSVIINDVILLSKRVWNPASKLQSLYNLLDEYRVSQTKPLFECEIDFILDIMNRTVY